MKRYWKTLTILTFAALLLFGWDINPWASATVPGTYSVVSSDSGGTQANSSNNAGESISGDGRYVAFSSAATNLVSGDTNGYTDVFVKDTQTGAVTLVSVTSAGSQGDGPSVSPSISYDGRYVVFESFADNFASVTSGTEYVFIHDMQTGNTSLVSASSAGTPGNHNSDYPSVNADGRFVVFRSYASNLVSGVSFANLEIYEKDMTTGTVKLLSQNSSGTQANDNSAPPHISCDGGVVVFDSGATNLPGYTGSHSHDVYMDVLSGGDNALANITSGANDSSDSPNISCNGNDVVYRSDATNLVSGDSNGTADIFEYNRLTGDNTLVSVKSNGDQLSSNSYADYPSVSDDGRFVTFWTFGSSGGLTSYLTTGEGSIYIHDLRDGSTQALAVDSRNYAVGGGSGLPIMSANGATVAFTTGSSYLVSGANGSNIFLSETGF